jgi:hypothetical protein
MKYYFEKNQQTTNLFEDQEFEKNLKLKVF